MVPAEISGSPSGRGVDFVLTVLLMGWGNMETILAVNNAVDGGPLGLEGGREGIGRVPSVGKDVM